jgi:hypothetical protein
LWRDLDGRACCQSARDHHDGGDHHGCGDQPRA